MESVRQTDEVYQGDHLRRAVGRGFLSFHIAACLFTPVHPCHCPWVSAFLTSIPNPIPLLLSGLNTP